MCSVFLTHWSMAHLLRNVLVELLLCGTHFVWAGDLYDNLNMGPYEMFYAIPDSQVKLKCCCLVFKLLNMEQNTKLTMKVSSTSL